MRTLDQTVQKVEMKALLNQQKETFLQFMWK